MEKSDHRYRGLLRARHERPRGRAAEKLDERAPLHGAFHRQDSARAEPITFEAMPVCASQQISGGLCQLRFRRGHSAMSASMSGLAESGPGWAIYEPYVSIFDLRATRCPTASFASGRS